jgi:hypothetical protein
VDIPRTDKTRPVEPPFGLQTTPPTLEFLASLEANRLSEEANPELRRARQKQVADLAAAYAQLRSLLKKPLRQPQALLFCNLISV